MNSRLITSLYAAGLLVAAGGLAPALAQTNPPPAPTPSQPGQAAPVVTPQNTPASKGTTMAAPSSQMKMKHHAAPAHMAKSHESTHHMAKSHEAKGHMAKSHNMAHHRKMASSHNANAQNAQVEDLNAQSLEAAKKGQAMQMPAAGGMSSGGAMAPKKK